MPRMPEISSGPSFSLCSLDLGLSSSDPPASVLPNRRLSKRTGRAFSAGLPSSPRLLGSILVSGALACLRVTPGPRPHGP